MNQSIIAREHRLLQLWEQCCCHTVVKCVKVIEELLSACLGCFGSWVDAILACNKAFMKMCSVMILRTLLLKLQFANWSVFRKFSSLEKSTKQFLSSQFTYAKFLLWIDELLLFGFHNWEERFEECWCHVGNKVCFSNFSIDRITSKKTSDCVTCITDWSRRREAKMKFEVNLNLREWWKEDAMWFKDNFIKYPLFSIALRIN